MKHKEQVTKDIPTREIKNHVMIDGRNSFYQSIRNNVITYDNIRNIAYIRDEN